MQGQLFSQDFLTRGVQETPPHQALSDTAFAAFEAALRRIYAGRIQPEFTSQKGLKPLQNMRKQLLNI